MKTLDYIRDSGKDKKILIMAHQVLGYPDWETNYEIIRLFSKYRIGLVELQIPFSEPMADGPTFLKANQKSLENGTTIAKCFEFAKKVKDEFGEIQFLFMTYYNILVQFGIEKFIQKTKEINFSGLIIPDATPENTKEEYFDVCKKYDIAPIVIVTRYSSDARIEYLSKVGDGFLYCVPRKGVTGNQTEFDDEIAKFTERCRRISKMPVGVGFGVQSAEDIRFLVGKSDIAIIGSKFLNVLEKDGIQGVEDFLASITK